MPNVTATPKGLVNGEVVTEFTDVTGTASVTYTYPVQQAGIMIENSGVSNIFVTVGIYTNQIVQPDKKWKADASFSSFSIRSDVNSQEFIATSFQNDVDGSGLADVVAREKITTLSNARNEYLKSIRTNGQRKCIVSFLSDDSYVEDYTTLKPIFQPLNIPISLAVITGRRNNADQLKDAQLSELYGLGWEFGSHTVSHLHLPALSATDQETELKTSKEWFEQKGYNCDYIVYPFGEHNQTTRDLARKYYRYGVQTGGKVVDFPLKTYSINRVALGAYFDGAGMDTLAYYKSKFDEAYANKKWVIFMLHPHDPAFNATQQQYLKDLISYIQTFPDVPFMTVGQAYQQMGNMLTVGDGTTEKLVITNTGDMIRTFADYSAELTNMASAWVTGTGDEQPPTPVDFVDSSNIKIRFTANGASANPSIVSVGKNIWGGLKAANDIIAAVNDATVAYFTVVDGRRCIALKASNSLMKSFFANGFIAGKQYVLSGTWRRDVTATGSGGSLRFKNTDGTYTGNTYAIDTNWTNFTIGSLSGKTVSGVEGNYGTIGNLVYIDIDTLQVEIGTAKSSYEAYKESRLDITATLAANDVVSFENNKLYNNATKIVFTNSLKAYKNGTMYLSDNSSPTVKIIYPLNTKAAQDLATAQMVSS